MRTIKDFDVSRETIERLELFAALLVKWNSKINLISKASIPEIWERHILDSAQVFQLAPHPVHNWADFGSGGGLPGLVIATMAQDKGSPAKVVLVESDARKCAFLRTVVRELELSAVVKNHRVEDINPLNADVISARALADLNTLFELSAKHISPTGMMIFPKGETWKTELEQAQSKWRFTYEIAKSKTNDHSAVICTRGVARV